MKRMLFILVALLSFVISNAQIGYQVALLNTATGEPRSNETVECEIKLTNSEDAVVYEGKQKSTSNDFGVVSLTVGDANTFSDMDWSKLPLSISVSVEGRLVGKTEVLSVPVAEYAKHYGTLTYENIGEKEVVGYEYSFNGRHHSYSFSFNGHNVTADLKFDSDSSSNHDIYEGTAYIGGNTVLGVMENHNYPHKDKVPFVGHYSPEDDKIYIFLGDLLNIR